VEPIPFRVPHHLPAVRPVGRTSFPEISGPYNDVTLGSPMWSRLSRPPRLRSQAFSTSQRFPSIPVLRGLVSCRSRSWDLPSEVSPRENRAPLSRPLAPLQSSTSAQRRAFRVLIAACFTDSHARAQLPGSPDDYGLPFHAPKRASRSPWNPSDQTAPSRWLRLLRSLAPLANPFAPARVAPTWAPFLSWVFAPLESPVLASDPRTRPGTSASACAFVPRLAPDSSSPRLSGPCSPPNRVRPPWHQKHQLDLVGRFQPPSRLARTASRRRSYSLGLQLTGPKPDSPDLRSLEMRRRLFSPKRKPPLLGFLPPRRPRNYGAHLTLAHGFTETLHSRHRLPAAS